jgi:hypothetical protein
MRRGGRRRVAEPGCALSLGLLDGDELALPGLVGDYVPLGEKAMEAELVQASAERRVCWYAAEHACWASFRRALT